jgi:hypothetical protein
MQLMAVLKTGVLFCHGLIAWHTAGNETGSSISIKLFQVAMPGG